MNGTGDFGLDVDFSSTVYMDSFFLLHGSTHKTNISRPTTLDFFSLLLKHVRVI